MARKGISGKHRSVIARKRRRDISQEPEMIELKELYSDMTDEEKERTVDYLQEPEEVRPDGKSHRVS